MANCAAFYAIPICLVSRSRRFSSVFDNISSLLTIFTEGAGHFFFFFLWPADTRQFEQKMYSLNVEIFCEASLWKMTSEICQTTQYTYMYREEGGQLLQLVSQLVLSTYYY